ncbi:MAG TPA: dephospho-CoA kinase [Candidatus Omnitrophica bacterium]|nr:dephospho-CoA kinase [Candidatus Omnitrophota bacterium]
MFAKLGAYAIDADKVYHSLIRPEKNCYKKIVKYFGKDILAKSGQIDRKKLGNIVFKDKSKLKILNSITHDEVIKGIKRIVKTKKGKVIIEAPLLIESGFYKEVDKVILVANKEEEQVKRIKEARGLSSKKILKRIRMQMPFKKKLALADFIIDNSGSKRDTLIQVKEIWKQKGV